MALSLQENGLLGGNLLYLFYPIPPPGYFHKL